MKYAHVLKCDKNGDVSLAKNSVFSYANFNGKVLTVIVKWEHEDNFSESDIENAFNYELQKIDSTNKKSIVIRVRLINRNINELIEDKIFLVVEKNVSFLII